jgi:hypothetical protein
MAGGDTGAPRGGVQSQGYVFSIVAQAALLYQSQSALLKPLLKLIPQSGRMES